MSDYAPDLKRFLRKNGCTVIRQGKGDHEIWHSPHASVDGPPDADWEAAWLAELDRRVEAARNRGTPAPEWSEVRARILNRLARR